MVLGLTFWVRYARVCRLAAMSLREREFVQAPATFGASRFWIIRKHLLPSVFAQVVVMASFDIGAIIGAEAALSYLGLGIQAPTPSWGTMIAGGQTYLQTNPWLAIVPGLAIFMLLAGIAVLTQSLTREVRGTVKDGSAVL